MVALATHLYGHIDHFASLAILIEASCHAAPAVASFRRKAQARKDAAAISKSAQKRANRRHH